MKKLLRSPVRAYSLLSQQNRYTQSEHSYYLWSESLSRERPSGCRLYTLHAVRDIFRRPHEETSALSGTCIIIAESAKQIHLV